MTLTMSHISVIYLTRFAINVLFWEEVPIKNLPKGTILLLWQQFFSIPLTPLVRMLLILGYSFFLIPENPRIIEHLQRKSTYWNHLLYLHTFIFVGFLIYCLVCWFSFSNSGFTFSSLLSPFEAKLDKSWKDCHNDTITGATEVKSSWMHIAKSEGLTWTSPHLCSFLASPD